jgi:hypothetical protein
MFPFDLVTDNRGCKAGQRIQIEAKNAPSSQNSGLGGSGDSNKSTNHIKAPENMASVQKNNSISSFSTSSKSVSTDVPSNVSTTTAVLTGEHMI